MTHLELQANQEVILLYKILRKKFYRVDSIGQICSRIVTLTAEVVHNVNNRRKSTQSIKCQKIIFVLLRSLIVGEQNTMLGMIHICISFAYIKLCRDVFQRMNCKTCCECAMKELVEVILLQGRLQQKFYRVDSIRQLCSRIVTLTAKVVNNVNNWEK